MSTSTSKPTVVSFKELSPFKKSESRKRVAAAGLQTLRANEEEGEEVGTEDKELPPLHVLFGIEAMQPPKQHVANLIVGETEDDPRPICF